MQKLALTLCMALILASMTHQNAKADDTNKPPASADQNSKPQLVEPAEAEKLIAEKKVVVLDVRNPAEFASGHIEGATNIDIHGKGFQTRLEQLDKNQPYLVHCAVGMRSAKACTVMSSLHFKTIYDLKGGLNAWEQAGKPVVK